MPEVSVIIPVYNNEKYVEECVRSVMRQTFKDLEIIVINDGSTDKSGEILEALSEADKRLRLFYQENKGAGAARNKGLDMAEGRYLVFVDGDDWIMPDYIETLYDAAGKTESEMVICGFSCAEESGKILREVCPGEYRRFEREECVFQISAVCSHFYKKSLWDKYQVRFAPDERGEDMPVSLFFGAVCDKISTVMSCGYVYRQHSGSAMHNFRGLRQFSLPLKSLEGVIRKIEETGVSNSREFYELFVLRILSTCFFQLAPGAPREKTGELAEYITRILHTYFPDYYKNSLTGLFKGAEVPFVQRAAVKVLIFLVRTGWIRFAAFVIGRKK